MRGREAVYALRAYAAATNSRPRRPSFRRGRDHRSPVSDGARASRSDPTRVSAAETGDQLQDPVRPTPARTRNRNTAYRSISSRIASANSLPATYASNRPTRPGRITRGVSRRRNAATNPGQARRDPRNVSRPERKRNRPKKTARPRSVDSASVSGSTPCTGARGGIRAIRARPLVGDNQNPRL